MRRFAPLFVLLAIAVTFIETAFLHELSHLGLELFDAQLVALERSGSPSVAPGGAAAGGFQALEVGPLEDVVVEHVAEQTHVLS